MFNNYLLLFMMKRLSNGINAMPGTGIFSHFSRADRNKGDIERKGCMDSIKLKRVGWTPL